MPKVKLGDVAMECRDVCKSEKTKLPAVGLEHLTPGEIKLSNWSETVDNTFTKAFRKGSMLFGRRRAYLKKAALAPFDGVCSGDITVIEALPGKLLSELLPFVIQNDAFFDYAVGRSAGSLSPRVKWEHLRNYKFDIPSFDCQRDLAEILWAVENTRIAYKHLVDQTDELVKSQFIEMFGELDNNIMKWDVKKFSEVATIDGNMTTEYEKYANYPHIGIDSIEKETGKLSGYRTVAEDNVISGKYIFGPQHILYSKIRPALNKVAVPDFEGLCSADCYPILPIGGWCEREFLAHVMRTDYFLKYVLAYSGRSQMPKVNRKQIEGFKFPCPPIEMQRTYIEFLKQSDKSKSELKRAIESANELIKSLLQQDFIN